MLTLDENRLIQDEHEEQYFGVSSTSVVLDFSEFVEYLIKLQMTEVKAEWGATCDLKQFEKLEDLYLNSAKDKLKLFEKEVRDCLRIPQSVIPEQVEVSDEEIIELSKEVEKLKQEYFEDCKFLDLCRKKKKEIDELEDLFKILENTLKIAQEPDIVKKMKENLAKRDGFEATISSNKDILSILSDEGVPLK